MCKSWPPQANPLKASAIGSRQQIAAQEKRAFSKKMLLRVNTSWHWSRTTVEYAGRRSRRPKWGSGVRMPKIRSTINALDEFCQRILSHKENIKKFLEMATRVRNFPANRLVNFFNGFFAYASWSRLSKKNNPAFYWSMLLRYRNENCKLSVGIGPLSTPRCK